MFLANVLATEEEGLVDRAKLVEFFKQCAAAPRAAGSSAGALPTARSVMIGAGGAPDLRRHRRFPEHDGKTVSTLVKWTDWWLFHVDQQRLQDIADHAVLGKPKADDDPERMAKYIESTCQGQWFKSNACLGGPITSQTNVWISTVDLDGGQPVPAVDVNGSAYQLADALGLPYAANDWVLRYTVDAGELRRKAYDTVARPSFADGGNGRLRVRNPSPYGRHCAQHGWGNTAHLASAVGGHCDGRPERVCLRVPLAELSTLRVQSVGKVHRVAADPQPIDEKKFAALLCNGRALDDIVATVKSWLP